MMILKNKLCGSAARLGRGFQTRPSQMQHDVYTNSCNADLFLTSGEISFFSKFNNYVSRNCSKGPKESKGMSSMLTS